MYFHTICAAVLAHGYLGLNGLVTDAFLRSHYGGHWRFLTIQGLAIAWLTMIVGTASNILPGNRTLRVVKRRLLMLAMPLSVTISVIYWSLFLVIPRLLFPLAHEDGVDLVPLHLPLSLDLVMLLAPAVSLVIDFYLWEQKYDKDIFYESIATTLMYATSYATWIEYCALRSNGVFPYPILTEASAMGRACIYTGASAIALLSFHLLNHLHS